MPDLHTTYLGLRLRSPLVASAGPATADVDRIVALEDAGAAAVVLPSLFEEQIERETAEIDRLFTVHDESFPEALSFFPQIDDHESGIDRYLRLVEEAAGRVDIPVIASLNGTNIGGWVKYARLLQDAGADAIELNLYTVAADPGVDGAALEREHLELVALVGEEVDVPVAVKISPYYSSLSAFVVEIERAGAAGVVMFNRFYSPDLDLETLSVMPRLVLSTPDELRLPLRWAGILRQHLRMSIAASTGVHSGFDVAKLLLAGADVAMSTSALLHHGPAHVATMEAQLVDWMDEHEYESVSQMRGAVASHATTDPTAYERANYIGNIATYTSRFMGTGDVPLARHRRAAEPTG
jgi:dihydroorotate dehydrogenase (fumarate)